MMNENQTKLICGSGGKSCTCDECNKGPEHQHPKDEKVPKEHIDKKYEPIGHRPVIKPMDPENKKGRKLG